MKSLTTLLQKKSIAAAILTMGFAAAAIGATTIGGPIVINLPNTPNDGMACVSAPNLYTGSQAGNTFFCKRSKTVNQALTCTDSRFPTKVIRQGPNGGGKDICAAPNRVYTSNDPLIGTEGIDYKFFAVDSAQVSTIVANQRQQEATALGVALNEVDATSTNSQITVNQTGSEDKLTVTVEFFTFPKTVGLFR